MLVSSVLARAEVAGPRTGGEGEASCRVELFRNLSRLPYNCDIAWERLVTEDPRVLVFPAPRTSPTAIDYLALRASGTAQFFACQTTSSDLSDGYGFSDGTHHWALAPGDDTDLWGWVPEVFFRHGADGSREENLPECSDEDKRKAGTRSEK